MTQVLIVGAGPVGLTLASELHRHGVEFRILDKAAAPHGNSQAAVLWPRTQEVLDLMGLRAHWDPISIPWRGMSLLGVDRHLADAPFEGVEGPHPLPILVGQDQTEKVFNAHLAEIGHPVERQREVIEVTPAADGAEARVRDADGGEETIRADWVVGCDGSGSVVRTAMGVEFKREFVRGFRFIQGDFRIRTSLPLEAGWGYVTLGPGNASCFLIQVAVDGHFRIAIGGDDVDAKDKGPPTLEQIQEQLRSFVAFDAELSDPTWLNLYRTSYSAATSFRAGRLLVAGDAAHVWIPVSGQGMNTGIQDAFNLAWKLAAVIQGRSADGLLDSYGVERRPVAEAEITSTVTQYRAMANADPMFRGVVQQFLAIAGNQPELIDRYMRQASEIEIAYVASPLSHSAGVTGLPAGSRAPDAYVGDPAQAATVRLFDLYRSGALTLLALCGAAPSKETIAAVSALAKEIADAFGDQVQVRALITDRKPAEAPAELRQLLDARGTAHRRFSATAPSIHLVRPDGYTAFRGALGDADALIAHLDRLICAKPRSGRPTS